MDAGTREPQMGLTFEKVWAMFQESDRDMRELRETLDESLRKYRREFDEDMRKSRREFDKGIRKSRQEFDKGMRELRASQQETDRLLKETDQLVKATARQMKKTDESIGKLGNRFGELAEHLVAPNIMEKFNERGYNFKGIAENQKIVNEQGQIIAEIDILLENGSYAVAVEVKAKPKITDIADFIGRLEILRRYKDENQDKRKIRGALAGAIFQQSVKDAAVKSGIYVIEQSGDTVKINVPGDFNPKEW